MFNISGKAKVDRNIPKSAFYRNANVSSKIKDLFANEIDKITMLYVIRPDVLNVAAKEWKELDIITITLKDGVHDLSPEILNIMDESLPRPVLFEIIAGQYKRLAISYKERGIKRDIRIVRSFTTKWQKDFTLDFVGLSVDAIYSCLITQIAGEDISVNIETPVTLAGVRDNIDKADARNKLKKDIEKLEKEYAKEYNAARRNEIAEKIHTLRLSA